MYDGFDRYLRVGSFGVEDFSTRYNFQVILGFRLSGKVLRNFEGQSCRMGSTGTFELVVEEPKYGQVDTIPK